MATMARDSDAEEPEALKSALDALYAAEPRDFTKLRKELATQLKAAGHADLSKRLGSARRPNRVAWLLNRFALTDPAPITAVFEAFDTAKAEQGAHGDASKWRKALAAYRENVTKLSAAARAVLEEAGDTANATMLRTLTQVVQSAAENESQRAGLLRGRSEKLGDDEDDDESLEAFGAPIARTAAKAPEPPKSAPRQTAKHADQARAHQERAEKERAEKERAERERLEKERAEKERRRRELERAERELEAAERAHERAESRLAEAKAAEHDARVALQAAKRAVVALQKE